MFKKFVKALLHLCWYSIAATIITIAVAVTLVRVLLPDLGQYREDVELFISEYSGYPVEIKEIDASWDGWIPNLKLNDISILDKESSKSLVHFDQAFVELDPVASIKQRSLIPMDLRISGIDLSFTRLENGSIIIVESGTSLFTDGQGEINQELTDWLRSQKMITIENANLTWLDEKNRHKPVQFKNASTKLSAGKDTLRLSGTASLSQKKTDTHLSYQINIFGDILSPDWSGTIDLAGNKLDFGQWLKEFIGDEVNLSHEPANVTIKSKFSEAKLTQLVAKVLSDEAILEKQGSTLEFKNLDIDLDFLRKKDQSWIVDIQLGDLTTQHGLWKTPAARLDIVRAERLKESAVTARIKPMSVNDLNSIINMFPETDANDYLHFFKAGEIKDIELAYQWHELKKNDVSLNASLNNFSIHHNNDVTLSGINGVLQYSDNRGKITIDSPDAILSAAKIFNQDHKLTAFNGEIHWLNGESETTISTDLFNIASKDLPITLKGHIKTGNNASIDMQLETANIDVETVPKYLPLTAHEDLKEWMNDALLGGNVLSAKTIIKGPLAKFPYTDEKEGIFTTMARVENAEIAYKTDWPAINKVNLDLEIKGKEMVIHSDKGNIMNARMQQVKALIPDLTTNKPQLRVTGEVVGDCEDLINYIDKSPLRENTALQTPKKIHLAGPMNLNINLDIPLTEGDQTKIKGVFNLLGNSVDSESTGIELEELKGQVNFTRDDITAENLTARYFEQELTLRIEESSDQHRVILNGDMDRDFIKRQFNHYYPSNTDLINDYLDQISGKSTWQASVNLLSDDNKEQQLLVTSDLQGIEIDLPNPLKKQKNERLPLTLETSLLNKSGQNLGLQFGDLLAAKMAFSESDKTVLESLNIEFGGKLQHLFNKNEVSLNGTINKLELSEWLKLIQKKSSQGIEKSTSIYDDMVVNLHVKQLELFNQHFSNVNFNINKPENDWHIDVNSDELKGIISIPVDNSAIVLNLSRLHLKSEDSQQKKVKVDPNQLPSIHAYIKEFTFDTKNLGEMYLETSAIDKGLSFDNISFNKEGIEISGHGNWIKQAETSTSTFNIDLGAENLGTMLETFDYGITSIQDGKTDINIEASWSGSPMDFQLENLDGAMTLIIDKGQILDINPKAGRLFGLLSVQSLPRRLSLDFSDLFGEGLSFDRIDGSFTLEHGNAYTNNLLMSGPSANIAITGRTGLVEQDYDQLVTVTPQIADTLPVASALFGPVGVGVGAVIYFVGELFDSIPSNIDKMLQYQYTITGSWDEPVVEKYQLQEETSG